MGTPSNDMKSYATADKGIDSLAAEAASTETSKTDQVDDKTSDHVGEKVETGTETI